MQIKTAMRYYLTIIRLATIKKEMTSAGEDMGEKVPLGFVGWNANWYSHYGKQYGISSKKLNREAPYELSISILSIYPKEMKTRY